MGLLSRIIDALTPEDRPEVDERIDERAKALEELERRRRVIRLSQLKEVQERRGK